MSASESSSAKKVYLDANILAYWAVGEPKHGRRLSPRAENCMKLLDFYVNAELEVVLQTSEWALGEMIQSLIDKVVWQKFPFESFELRELHSMKKELELTAEEKTELNEEVDKIEKFIGGLEVQIIPVKYDHKMIHDLVIKYGITTNDAIHVQTASGVSDYLVTVDKSFYQAGISEIEVINPGNLITIKELRSRKGR